MQVDLQGRAALVLGAAGPVAETISARLREAGATVAGGEAAPPPPSTPLDILVYVLPDLLSDCAAGDMDPAAWEAAVLDGIGPAMRAARDAASRMQAGGGGRIVFVTGAPGVVSAKLRSAAAAASAAVAALARTLAMEQGPRGVLVNVVALGPSEAAEDARLLSHVPLRRGARPEDAAQAALFMVAPASSYVTGHVLVVDGGWSAGFARDF